MFTFIEISEEIMSLFQLHGDGTIWQYMGTPMTGWKTLDKNPGVRVIAIVESGMTSSVIQLRADGTCLKYNLLETTGWT
jgi:hypothetical protein